MLFLNKRFFFCSSYGPTIASYRLNVILRPCHLFLPSASSLMAFFHQHLSQTIYLMLLCLREFLKIYHHQQMYQQLGLANGNFALQSVSLYGNILILITLALHPRKRATKKQRILYILRARYFGHPQGRRLRRLWLRLYLLILRRPDWPS